MADLNSAPALPPRVRANLGTPLAGRAKELAQLDTELDLALGGQVRLVLIAGEPGIGKSRLASELTLRAVDRGFTLLFGQCDDAGIAPFDPITGALDELAKRTGRGAAGTEATPELPAPAADQSPEVQRFQFFEALTEKLRSITNGTPLLLILEDLHWADEALILFLRHLARSPQLASTIVLGTFRHTDIDAAHPIRTLLRIAGRDNSGCVVELAGLDETELRDLVRALNPAAGGDDDQLARLLSEATEGNPFFALQLLRHLDEPADPSGLPVPSAITELINERLARLPAATVETLRWASILGRDFDVATLATVTDGTPAAIHDAIDTAAATGLVEELRDTPGHCRFTHAIVRDAVYGRIRPGERSRRHRAVGLALESRANGGPSGHLLAQLARHFREAIPAGEGERALRYARHAGDAALASFAFADAANHFRLALDLGDQGAAALAPRDRLDLLLRLGRAQTGVEALQPSLTAPATGSLDTTTIFAEAIDLARQAGDPELVAEAALASVGHWLEGGGAYGQMSRRMLRLHETALAAMGDEPSHHRLAVVQSLHALAASASNIPTRAWCLAESERIAAALGDPLSRAFAFHAKGLEASESWRCGEAVEHFDNCIGALAAHPGHSMTTRALFMRILNGTRARDIAGTFQAIRALGDLARRENDTVMCTWVECFYAGGSRVMAGDLQGALRANAEARRAGREIGSKHLQRQVDSQGAHTNAMLGCWDAVRPIWQPWLDRAPPALHTAVAWFAARTGTDSDLAHQLMARLDTLGLDFPQDRYRVNALAFTAEACAFLGLRDHGEALYPLLLPYADRAWDCGSPAFPLGSISRPLGMLATMLERYDDARQHFEDAIAFNENMGHRPALIETRVRLGQMLLARGREQDRDHAIAILADAFDTAAALGFVISPPVTTTPALA